MSEKIKIGQTDSLVNVATQNLAQINKTKWAL